MYRRIRLGTYAALLIAMFLLNVSVEPTSAGEAESCQEWSSEEIEETAIELIEACLEEAESEEEDYLCTLNSFIFVCTCLGSEFEILNQGTEEEVWVCDPRDVQ